MPARKHKRAAPVHFNSHGHRCHCPFGDPRKEKYQSKHEQEWLGSTHTAMWHEASKYDWLMDRPDVKDDPELQKVVNKFRDMGAEPGQDSPHDPLLPWLLREYKKGRIQDRYPNEEKAISFTHTAPEGYQKTFDTDHLDQIMDWMKYQKQKKEGVDIMKHEVGPAVQQANKNDLGGEVVHTFGSPEDETGAPSWYNGHTVVRLRNDRDMRREGQRMNHCVGSNGMGYLEKNREGKGAYYSLRDQDNDPYATIEMEPHKDSYMMCPHCKKPTFGEIHHPLEGPMEDHCTNCNATLGTMDPESRVWSHPGVDHHDTKINYKKPTHDHMQVTQMFGHSDKKLDQEQEELANHWLSHHGHPYQSSDGDEDYEDEYEEEFEPWWDDYYHVDGARNVEDWFNHHVDGDYYDQGPEEYDRARADADEHNTEGPDLILQDPDIEDIFQDAIPQGMGHVDPEMYKDLFKSMQEHGYGDEFRKYAQDWLDSEYHPYGNPYGEPNYVSPGPHEDLFAKNLNYHLQPYRHPSEAHPLIQHLDHGVPQNKLLTDREIRERHQDDMEGHGMDRYDYKGPYESDIQENVPPEERTVHDNQGRLRGEVQTPNPDYWTTPTDPQANRDHPYQGQMFPPGWYTNNKGYRRQTELPPHLFPPKMEHSNGSSQDQGEMWTNYPGGATVRTMSPFQQPSTKLPQDHPQWQEYMHAEPPRTEWNAHTAGEWTDWENGGPDPKPSVPQIHGVPHLNGRVMESNATTYPEYESMDWRLPTVYHHAEDKLYVGQPAMEHGHMMQQWNKPSPWVNGMTAHPEMSPGYIDLGTAPDRSKSSLGLQFFGQPQIPNEHELHDWVEQRYGVRGMRGVQDLTDEDWKTSGEKTAMPWTQYGPRDEGLQEWAEWKTQPKKINDPENAPYLKAERPLHPPPQPPQPEPPPKPDLSQMTNYERDEYDRHDWQNNPHPFKWDAANVPGKAFMDTNGQVHTWDERSGSRYWMHSDQAQMRGVKNDYDTHIYMEPGGYVDDRYRVGKDYPERARQMYKQLQEGHPEVQIKWPAVTDNMPAPEPAQPDYATDDSLWD